MKPLHLALKNRHLVSVAQVIGLRSLTLAVNVATGMISAWTLGPRGRGVQTAIMLGPLSLAGVFDFGFHASLIYNLKADPEHKNELFGCALVMAALSGLAGMVVGWLLAPLFLAKYDGNTIVVSRYLMIAVPILVTSSVLGAVLEVNGKFGFTNLLALLSCVSTLLFLLVFSACGVLDPATAAAAYAMPAAPVFALLWWRAARMVRPIFAPDRQYYFRTVKNAIRFYGLDLLAVVSAYIDQFILVVLLDPHNLGLYVVALSAARVLTIISTSISTVLFPTIAARSQEAIVEIVGVALRVNMMATALAAVVLSTAAPYLLTTLYGDKFEEAILPFRILVVYMGLNSLAMMQYQIFSASGRPEIVTTIELVGLLLSCAGMVLFVPLVGTAGAAVSLVCAALVKNICIALTLRFVFKRPLPPLLPRMSDLERVLRPASHGVNQ